MDIAGLFGKKNSSKDVAKERLKLVLIHDRVDCSTQILEMLKVDIIRVISNYMEIDENEIEMHVTKTKSERSDSNVPMLYANIPIRSMRKLHMS